MIQLREMLLEEYSRANMERVGIHVGHHPALRFELYELMQQGEKGVCEKAAWAMSYIPEEVIQRDGKFLLPLIAADKPVSVRRNAFRAYETVNIEEDFEGALWDICYEALRNLSSAPALKAYSITVLNRIAERHPELRQELLLTLEDLLPFAVPAVCVRARRVLEGKRSKREK